jgi:NADPH:quinone reductase-like Zn-dependent oxidoreductase
MPRVLSAVQLASRQTAGCHGTFPSRRQLIGGWPGGRRAVAVFDAVGKSSFGRCRRLLKPGGIHLLMEGPLFLILILITPLFGGKKVMFALPQLDQAMVGHIKELIESGQFKRRIDRRYRLDQIIDASKYVETGQKIGNVVISVEPQN